MADVADVAQDLIEREDAMRSQARDARRAAAEAARAVTECEECGADIPKARQKAVRGCTLCIECQSVREHVGRVRRG
jgi:phage/conjugal plasmid C-4 type zinc finger TraR family protein